MSRDLGDMRLLTTSSTRSYAEQVYHLLLNNFESRYRVEFPNTNPLINANVSFFPNKEIDIQIDTSVRKRNVYAFHAFTGYEGELDPNIGFMQLHLLDDALRNANPESITYIVPFIPYQRQDRIDRPRVAISARKTAQLFFDTERPTTTTVVTFDMHSPQQQGFYLPIIENLRALPLFATYCKEHFLQEGTVVVSPDVGGARRARDFASGLNNTEIYIIDKRRDGSGSSQALNIVGPTERIRGNRAIIIDDIIDTGGTIVEAAHALEKAGATDIYAFATHGIFSPLKSVSCEERMKSNGIKVVITDTIPRNDAYYSANKDWLTTVSTADIVAKVVYRLQRGLSLADLFDSWGY